MLTLANWTLQQPLAAKPGQQYSYTNDAFWLLTYIIEKASQIWPSVPLLNMPLSPAADHTDTTCAGPGTVPLTNALPPPLLKHAGV